MNKRDWNSYTDEDNVEFAKAEYTKHSIKGPYAIGKDNQTAGYVQERFGFNENGSPNTDYNGAQAYVVTPQNHQNLKNVKDVARI